jgi:hypothetical protein
MTITKQSIIKNLKEVAGNSKTLTREQFRNSSRRQVASSTIEQVFGSFTLAVKAAKIGR